MQRLTACSSAQIANKEGSELIESGQYEAGLARIEEGLREDPRDTQLHIALNSGRALAVTTLPSEGDMDRAQRNFPSARMAYGRVLNIEPNNRRAQEALHQLDYLRSMDEKLELARGDLRRGDIYGADRQVKQILELDPKNEGAWNLPTAIFVWCRAATWCRHYPYNCAPVLTVRSPWSFAMPT